MLGDALESVGPKLDDMTRDAHGRKNPCGMSFDGIPAQPGAKTNTDDVSSESRLRE